MVWICYFSIFIYCNSSILLIKYLLFFNIKLYIDNKHFLLTWNHPSYGKFAVPFEIKNNKVSAIEIKASDFVEYDGYVFLKN